MAGDNLYNGALEGRSNPLARRFAVVRRFAVLGSAFVALALAAVPASLAQRATTSPGNRVQVYFVIRSDKSVTTTIYRLTAGGGSDVTYLDKYVLRGDIATFFIVNRTKKPYGFEFYGHRFAVLKPGKKDHFDATLLKRGSFPFELTAPGGRAPLKGVFHVY